MTKPQFLKGRMLLAMPGMFDPRFARSVNVMCVHDKGGAMGIGIGHTLPGVRLHALLENLDIDPGVAPDCTVLRGGPVEPHQGFVLHSIDWLAQDTIKVPRLCALTSSVEVLRQIARGKGPRQWIVALGYAGWGPGQLENEMRHHGWHAAAGSADVIFGTETGARWEQTWRAEGIDPALLAHETGHA